LTPQRGLQAPPSGRRLAPTKAASSTASAKPVAVAKEEVELGKSGLMVSSVGIGAWSWGDRSLYWDAQGAGFGKEGAAEAFQACLELGATFIDTAEVYGFELSEKYLGEFMRDADTRPVIATKFAPLPWRQTPESLVDACKASLGRLGLDSCGLYMQHWPGFFLNAFSNDAFLEGLVRCRQQGLCQAVGVSNFNAQRLRAAHRRLAQDGVPLASNQVQYSLVYRGPERNGVLETCRELGVTLVAYSPLGTCY